MIMLLERHIFSKNKSDTNQLKKFLDENEFGKKTFRYYEKRNLEIIDNHICTILFENNGETVGYGHLDKEKDIVWLGIMVGDRFKGLGYGKKIMSQLINKYENEIYLTVDKDNIVAASLYKKFGFTIIEENEIFYKMKLKRD